MYIPTEELAYWGGRRAEKEVAERGEVSERTRLLLQAVIRSRDPRLVEAWDRGRENTTVKCLYGNHPSKDCGARACPIHGTPSGDPFGKRQGAR